MNNNDNFELEQYLYSKTKEELFKRYAYLYENKELILALCIKPDIDELRIKKNIKELYSIKRNIKTISKKTNDKALLEETIPLVEDLMNARKKQLKEPTYYLFAKVDNEITEAFEEFLFTNDEIENTTLYKHIEAVKNNKLYLASFTDIIEKLEDRRSFFNQIADKKTFTVWKILTYVRRKNLNNPKTLESLDKYYNLDRYITTGLNYKSGYIYSKEDVDNIDIINSDYINKLTSNLFPNSFEFEDQYFDTYYTVCEDTNNNSDYKTAFMYKLAVIPDIKEEDKKEFRNKLTNKSKGMMTKSLKKCIINMEG